jgi:predicted ester cyclase
LAGEAIAFRGSFGAGVQGRNAFKEYVRTVQRAFRDFHNRIDERIAQGDRVVARLTYTGTHQGVLFDIRPNGRPVRYAGVAVFRIAEGHIVDGWVLGDVHGLVRQLRGGESGA